MTEGQIAAARNCAGKKKGYSQDITPDRASLRRTGLFGGSVQNCDSGAQGYPLSLAANEMSFADGLRKATSMLSIAPAKRSER